MKKALLLTASVACFWSVPVRAQSDRPAGMTTEVPFAFVSGGKTLPAGRYSVETGQTWIRFTDARGHPVQTLLPNSREDSVTPAPRLVFQQYGGQFFLCQIRTASTQYGFKVARREHQREAGLNTQSGIVTTALR